MIKPVIATIEQGLVIRQLGRLSERDRKVLAESLRGFWDKAFGAIRFAH